MSQPSFHIRQGTPSTEDAQAAAWFLDTAAEGFFRILLGQNAAKILAQAYVRPHNEYSYENTLIAERDGKQVGMAFGFTSAQRRAFPKNPLRDCEGYPRVRAGLLGFLFHPMLRILETIPDDDFYLLSLAVEEDQRGMGVGSSLIEATEVRASEVGARRFSLDVAAKNDGAQRVYRRQGFEAYERWPKWIHLKRVGLYRMAKEL